MEKDVGERRYGNDMVISWFYATYSSDQRKRSKLTGYETMKKLKQRKYETAKTGALIIALIIVFPYVKSVHATPFTPLEWQQTVPSGPQEGQKKLQNSVLDTNQNFVDDKLDALPSGTVPATADTIIFLNKCLSSTEIDNTLSPFGNIQYKGKFVTFLSMDNVTKADIEAIASHPDVAFVEMATPFESLLNISAPTVKSRVSAISPGVNDGLGIEGAGVNIAILDSGVDDAIHEAFTGKFVAGFNAVTNTIENPDNDLGPSFHGTHVAGIALGESFIAADPRRITFRGVAPRAGLVDIQVANAATRWACDADVPDGPRWRAHVEALEKAIEQKNIWGIDVINMSFRQCDSSGNSIPSNGQDVFSQLVDAAVARGTTVVAAAANDSTFGTFTTPAAASLAITVAASAHEGTVERGDDTIADFSNRGRRDDDMDGDPLDELKPDVAAPGTHDRTTPTGCGGNGIFSAQGDTANGIQPCRGTSMAAPHVAGAAALILEAKPFMNPGSIKELLKQTAETAPAIPGMETNGMSDSPDDPKYDIGSGDGLIDAFAAVSAVAATDVKFPGCIDGGSPCLLSPDNTSPPNWLNTTDITLATDPPVAGMLNEIHVEVTNTGANDARGVKINFGVYRLTAGPSIFYELGSRVIDISAGDTVTVTRAWPKPEVGHHCIQVTIDYGLDSNFTNNVTQRNIEVRETSSPAVFTFDVENPLTVPATIELETLSDNPKWTCSLDQTSFPLDPFADCPRTITATLNPIKDAINSGSGHDNIDRGAGPAPRPPIPPAENGRVLLGGVSVRATDEILGTATCHVFAFAATPRPLCFGVPATIVGTNRNDALNGTSGDDVIVGLGGNDVINGRDGNDLICGGDGNDAIESGAGNNKIDGGAGEDAINGGNDNDLVNGGADKDVIKGGAGNDGLDGSLAFDELNGGSGTDTCVNGEVNAGCESPMERNRVSLD